MFDVFIEWYLIKALRRLYDKGSHSLMVSGNIEGEPCIPKNTFLIGVVKTKWLGIIKKPQKIILKKATKYKKILQKSAIRTKPLITETTFEINSREQLENNPFFNGNNLVKWGINSKKDVKFIADDETRKRIIIILTGEGYRFTFWVAATEFVKEYVGTWWTLLVAITSILLIVWKSDYISELKIMFFQRPALKTLITTSSEKYYE